MKKIVLTTAVLALALTACGKQEDAAPAAADAPTATTPDAPAATEQPVSRWDESAAPVEGAVLTINPSEIDLCGAKTTKVDVTWDVTTIGVKKPQIWVRDRTGEKIWVALKEMTGTKTTGNWVKAQTEFLLVDPASKKLLNEASVTLKTCN